MNINRDFVKILLGSIWLVINLAIDIFLVTLGFFPMTITRYFTDIGLRYLSMPIFTTGLGYALKQRS